MAISEKNDLIGYDPLAWMEVSTDKSEGILLIADRDNESAVSEPIQSEEPSLIETEISIPNYPEDLIEDCDESAILADLSDDKQNITNQDDFVVNEIAASDSVIIEDLEDDCPEALSEEIAEAQIDLDATLTIQHVATLHEILKNSLALHDEIEINASDVVSIDTATLQLLVSLKKDADKLKKKVSIIYPSPRFVESAQLLGLLDVLDIAGL